MELTLETLDYLFRQKYRTLHNGNWSPKHPIKKVKLWDAQSTDADTLYLLLRTELSRYQVQKNPALHILYITNEADVHEQGYYLLCNDEAPLCALNGVLDIYMSYLHWNEAVLRYDQYAHNLQALLNCTSEYLKIDLRIISKTFQNLFSDDHNSVLPWTDIIDDHGKMTLPSIQQLYIDDPDFDQTFLQKELTEYVLDELSSCKMYYYNIFDNENYVGRLLIYLKKETADPALLPFLASCCTHVENCFLYLHRRNHSTASYAHLHEYLHQMFRLLPVDHNTVTVLLQNIGWNKAHQFQILRFQTKGYGTSSQTMNYFCPQIEHELSHCIAFSADNGIYCIHNLTLDSQNLFEKKLPYFLRDNLFQVGMSCIFHDFFKSPNYAREALTALQFGQEMAPEKWIHSFEEYALSYCMKQVTQEFSREDLCHPSLLALIAYDQENPGTELVKTLYQ